MSGRTIGWLLGGLALLWQPVQAQTVVEYIHTDVLGSVVLVTDQNRNVIERREYEPYGLQLTPAVQDGPGYTGHVQDAVTGLTYMQQRYYDPMIGRVLSVDPVTALDNGDMRHFNRYAYVYNNPYKFTDPDGRLPDWMNLLFGKSVDTVGPKMEFAQGTADAVNRDTKGLQDAVATMGRGQQALSREIDDRVSVNAKFNASAGTGIQGNLNIAGKGQDSIGWVPVGEGLYAGATVDVKVFEFDLFDGKSAFSFDIGGDVGAGGSVGGSLSLSTSGQLSGVLSVGVGLGQHTKYSPTVNAEINVEKDER